VNWLLSLGSLFLKAIVEGVISYFRQRERDQIIAHDGAVTTELAHRDAEINARKEADKIHNAPKPDTYRDKASRLGTLKDN